MAAKFSSGVRKRAYYRLLLVCEVIAALVLRIVYSSFARLTVRNAYLLQNVQPPYIIVSNHANYNDPFIIGAATFFSQKKILPYCFMTLPRFLKWPVAGQLIRLLGSFPVFPKNGGLEASLKVAVNILREKRGSIIMFPEGKREVNHHHHNARPGIAYLMKQFPGIPVVPMFIKGNKPIPPWQFFLGRMKLTVTIGEPFTCESLQCKNMDDRALAKEVMRKVTALERAKE